MKIGTFKRASAGFKALFWALLTWMAVNWAFQSHISSAPVFGKILFSILILFLLGLMAIESYRLIRGLEW